MANVRVMIADDYAALRTVLARALRAEPGIEVVGEAADGYAAVRLAEKLRPDVVLMDINMPGLDGFEATRCIVQRDPQRQGYRPIYALLRLLCPADARGRTRAYVLKDADIGELIEVIEAVCRGETYVSSEVVGLGGRRSTRVHTPPTFCGGIDMSFDFDTVHNRWDTDSLKWGRYRGHNVIPMWVADMDFPSPPSIVEALHRRVEHGIFGYATPPQELVQVVVGRMRERYRWEIDPSWIVWLPGVVPALNIVCRAYGQDGDEVVTFTPVYPPFLTAPPRWGKSLRTIPLRRARGPVHVRCRAVRARDFDTFQNPASVQSAQSRGSALRPRGDRAHRPDLRCP